MEGGRKGNEDIALQGGVIRAEGTQEGARHS
jgi:hypothetical protein